MYDNMLTGQIPSTLGELTRLEYISFDDNVLSGSLPMEFELLTLLDYVSFSYNDITGTLPSFRDLELLGILILRGNMLTGTLSSHMGQLTALEELILYSNHFEGPVPIELSNCSNMRILQLQNNFLTGTLDDVFRGDMVVENIDLSNNKFSGDVPQAVFRLPHIAVVALSLNCFEGALPETMCLARNISVLSMDGLGAAVGCKHSFQVPLSGVTLFNTLRGSLPECVWSLPLLQVLHLTGNGLTGSIPDDVVIGRALHTISLGKCHPHCNVLLYIFIIRVCVTIGSSQ
jgi:hypothetical protein